MEAIALLTMAQDLSNTIKHISQIIQLTVGKYAQILTHAAMGTTSPYALPFSFKSTLHAKRITPANRSNTDQKSSNHSQKYIGVNFQNSGFEQGKTIQFL